jgi:UDP-3-O-[3-hydroxymyristoyl] glucosamine N-acyltransferase
LQVSLPAVQNDIRFVRHSSAFTGYKKHKTMSEKPLAWREAPLEPSIDPNAKIGKNVSFGHGTRVYGNVQIGDNCRIGDFCVIGHPSQNPESTPLIIGEGATIRSHAVLYEGSKIGAFLETGHHIVIREGSRIGENLRVGNFCDIEGACDIGDFVRMHGYAHVGRGSVIGDFVWLFSLTTLMNDPLPPSHLSAPVRIGDMATICVNAQIMPGASIGRGAFIAAGAVANGDIPAGVVISGAQGEIAGPVRFLMHMESRTRHPWHKHFTDAYPERARDRIKALGAEIDAEAASATDF